MPQTPAHILPTSFSSVVVLIIRTLFCEPHHNFPPTGTILVMGLLAEPRTKVWEDWGSQKLPVVLEWRNLIQILQITAKLSHIANTAHLLLSDKQSPPQWPKTQTLCCLNTWNETKEQRKAIKLFQRKQRHMTKFLKMCSINRELTGHTGWKMNAASSCCFSYSGYCLRTGTHGYWEEHNHYRSTAVLVFGCGGH